MRVLHPGWLTATAALLNRVTRPDDARIAAELAGNICRCCTYPRIMRAVRRAAELMEQPELLQPVPPGADLAAGRPLDRRDPPAAPALPWDQAAKDEASFFEVLDDGLVTVVADEASRGRSRPVARSQSAWVHVGADGSVTGVHRQGRGGPGHAHRARAAGRRGARGAAGIGAGGHGQHRCLAL